MHPRNTLLIGLSFATAACGSVVNNPDATQHDACIMCIDAVRVGPVKVFAIANNALVANADVIFQNADDSVVATLKTDATGTVHADMLAGGSVTVIMPLPLRGREQDVFTWVGVKPGDELLTADKPVPNPAPVPRVFNLPIGSGADPVYTIRTECGSAGLSSASITVDLAPGCTMSNVYVTVRSATFAGSFYVPNLTFPAGAVDLTTRLYVRAKNIPAKLTNVPAFISSATTNGSMIEGKLEMDAPDSASSVFPTPLSPTTMTNVALPNIAVADGLYFTNLRRSSGASQLFFERAGSDAYTLDLALTPMPWLLSAPAIDLSAKAAVWTESADGNADAVFMQYRVARPTPGLQFQRQVISPYSKNKVRIPQLPPPGDGFNLVASDTATALSVQLATFTGGFDSVRAIAFSGGSLSERLPTRGRYSVSTF